MPWNDTARNEHRRDAVGYPSDLRVREWALIAPLLPPAKRGGRPRTSDLQSRCRSSPSWRRTAASGGRCRRTDAPVPTGQGYFHAWRDSGLCHHINHLLIMSKRAAVGIGIMA